MEHFIQSIPNRSKVVNEYPKFLKVIFNPRRINPNRDTISNKDQISIHKTMILLLDTCH